MIASIRRWDIAVLPFPYTDQDGEKKRPALIISDAQFHEAFGTCWAIMITSAKQSAWSCDIPIPHKKSTGLPLPCVIRPAKLVSVDLGRILRKTGTIAQTERQKVAAFLTQHFDFLVK